MTRLQDILSEVKTLQIAGSADMPVTAVCLDSRAVQPGALFLALRGTLSDGHQYIGAAIDKGAGVIVCETLPANIVQGITYIQVADAAAAAGPIAAAFYGHPSRNMRVTGVTGTNGKTTTATLLYRLFTRLGYPCGLISTVANFIIDKEEPATHTTPDAVAVQALLRRMQDAGCSHVFMEVSSHAVHQQRINGIQFAGGVFTNITHDHLDYHKTFDEYIRVKKAFFDSLPTTAFALTNIDDKRGGVMLQNTKAGVATYSLRSPATYKGRVLENNLTGLVLDINGQEIHCRLVGTFNAYNLLAVYGAALELGTEKGETLTALSALQGAPGRFETFMSPADKILGIVDYAHTPDALLNVVATVNQLRKEGQQLITIIGCGGDRDKAKRPIMAQVACEHSDRAILTSDNPRTEQPEAILDDMAAGLSASQKRKSLRISDRREAIKTALALAQEKDIILIAGKGHETYQEIAGKRYDFDDRKILATLFEEMKR